MNCIVTGYYFFLLFNKYQDILKFEANIRLKFSLYFRGELSKNESEKIFRRWFRHLGELRSIFPEACMLALSATCTNSILQEVLSALSMESANRIIVSPDKSNIKYTVFRTGRAMESS